MRQGKAIKAYTNKFLSPVSIESVVTSIQILIDSKHSGVFQLGSNEEISYFQFAQSYFKDSPDLIKLIRAEKENKSTNSIKFNSLETYLPKQNSFKNY